VGLGLGKAEVGCSEGAAVVGEPDGIGVGEELGDLVSPGSRISLVGDVEGTADGPADGLLDGAGVVGEAEGILVDGKAVGVPVGATVSGKPQATHDTRIKGSGHSIGGQSPSVGDTVGALNSVNVGNGAGVGLEGAAGLKVEVPEGGSGWILTQLPWSVPELLTLGGT
jgi:hypothetical protein